MLKRNLQRQREMTKSDASTRERIMLPNENWASVENTGEGRHPEEAIQEK